MSNKVVTLSNKVLTLSKEVLPLSNKVLTLSKKVTTLCNKVLTLEFFGRIIDWREGQLQTLTPIRAIRSVTNIPEYQINEENADLSHLR